MKKTILIMGGALLALLLSGCIMREQYTKEEDCQAACEEKGFSEGLCLKKGTEDKEAKDIGNCIIKDLKDCSRPNQCSCFCAGVEEAADDEVSLFLKELEKGTGIKFSKIEDVEFKWMVPIFGTETSEEIKEEEIEEAEEVEEVEEETTREITIAGRGFEAKEISKEESDSVGSELKNKGFEVDGYNVTAEAVSNATGYKKDLLVCLVEGGISGWQEAGRDFKPEKTDVFDVKVACGMGDESLNPEVPAAEAIRRLLANKYNKKVSEVTVTIEDKDEAQVRGKVEYAPGGSENSGIFFAAKAEGEWQLAFDGEGAIPCEQLEFYGFSEEMKKDCEETQKVETKKDEEFEITLAANATTGYEWQLEFDEKLIELLDRNYKVSDENKIGAGGLETFKFKALDSGETEIIFSYMRPWESKPAIEKKVYKVTIE